MNFHLHACSLLAMPAGNAAGLLDVYVYIYIYIYTYMYACVYAYTRGGIRRD